jgi:hypothetical protein
VSTHDTSPSAVSRDFPEAAGFGAAGLRLAGVTGAVGAIALLGALALAWPAADAGHRFLYAYLPAFTFFLTISLGALFFVVLQHLTRAGWSIAVRRVAELLASNLALLAVLALVVVVPTLLGKGSLYEWADPVRAQTDAVIHAKAGYLNGPFFALRIAVYFALWVALARWYLGRSTAQDAGGDPTLTTAMETRAAPAMIVFALTATFGAFDLVMSLDPHWYSTIFGVYVFAGSALGFFAVLALVMMALQGRGRLVHVFTAEHYHDVGKLLFAFVFFWGYIAFSQFMLIWYANIPEETRWYRDRFAGGWLVLSLVLLFGHLLVPFVGLLSRVAKRRKPLLAFWSVFLLVMHYVDLYWLIVPTGDFDGVPFGVVDLLCIVGVGGLYAAGFLTLGRSRALVPVRDPRLSESLAFENV